MVSSLATACPHCGAPLQPNAPQDYSAQNPQNGNGYAGGNAYAGAQQQSMKTRPSNHLVWAILALFFCFPLGIIPLVFSLQVDSLWSSGDEVGAVRNAARAKSWSKVLLILAFLGIVLLVLFYVGIFALIIAEQNGNL